MLSFSRPIAFFSLRKDQAFWCFRALGFMFTVAWRVREDWLRHSGELSVTFLCLFFPTLSHESLKLILATGMFPCQKSNPLEHSLQGEKH